MIGQLIAIVFFVIGIYKLDPFLLFIGLFIFLGAGQELYAFRQARVMAGVTVRQAMMTDIKTLQVGATLREAADTLLATSQHDFPVVHGNEVMGVLTRNGLLRGLAEEGPNAYVAGSMERTFQSVGPDDDLTEMLQRLQEQSTPLVVLGPEPERPLLGMVTGDNLAEFFAVRQIVDSQKGNGYAPRA
jgi:stage IV sporulation protein FB